MHWSSPLSHVAVVLTVISLNACVRPYSNPVIEPSSPPFPGLYSGMRVADGPVQPQAVADRWRVRPLRAEEPLAARHHARGVRADGFHGQAGGAGAQTASESESLAWGHRPQKRVFAIDRAGSPLRRGQSRTVPVNFVMGESDS